MTILELIFTVENRGNALTVARKRNRRTSLNFTFNLNTLYLASILLTWLKFMCVNVRSQERVSGNQPLATMRLKKEYYDLFSNNWWIYFGNKRFSITKRVFIFPTATRLLAQPWKVFWQQDIKL